MLINVAIAQVVVLDEQARGPWCDSQKGRIFFHFNYFSRGNETDGKEQQQQTKKLLSDWLTLFDF